MTKAEVITEISQKTGIDKADVSATLEGFFTVVKNSLSQGENIYVRGFGSFIVKRRAEKIGRIISRKQAIVIPEHSIPSFKPAKVFMEKVRTAPVGVDNSSDLDS